MMMEATVSIVNIRPRLKSGTSGADAAGLRKRCKLKIAGKYRRFQKEAHPNMLARTESPTVS